MQISLVCASQLMYMFLVFNCLCIPWYANIIHYWYTMISSTQYYISHYNENSTIVNTIRIHSNHLVPCWTPSLIARYMGPTWDPSGANRTQVGPMLDPWILLSRLHSQMSFRVSILIILQESEPKISIRPTHLMSYQCLQWMVLVIVRCFISISPCYAQSAYLMYFCVYSYWIVIPKLLRGKL